MGHDHLFPVRRSFEEGAETPNGTRHASSPFDGPVRILDAWTNPDTMLFCEDCELLRAFWYALWQYSSENGRKDSRNLSLCG